MPKKTIVCVALLSVSLLLFISIALFYVAWTSMTTVAQLREENYRLSIEASVCKMRGENPDKTPEQVKLPSKAPAFKDGASKEKKAAPETVNFPQQGKGLIVSEGKDSGVLEFFLVPRSVSVTYTEPVELEIVAEPLRMQGVMKTVANEMPELVLKPAVFEEKVSEVSVPAAAREDKLTQSSTFSVTPGSDWVVQAGAYDRKIYADIAAKRLKTEMRDAGLKYEVLVGKGSLAHYWKVYVAPTSMIGDAKRVRESLENTLRLSDAFVAPFPKSLTDI